MSIISHLIYRFPFCVKGRKLFQAAGQGRAGQGKKTSCEKCQRKFLREQLGETVARESYEYEVLQHGSALLSCVGNLRGANDKLLSSRLVGPEPSGEPK